MGMQKYKKQKIPDKIAQQKLVNRKFLNGNENFYSDNIDFAPANVKFRRKHKYEKKLLVWIAMSPRGISEPFIMASGNAVDQFVYRDKTASFYQKKSF